MRWRASADTMSSVNPHLLTTASRSSASMLEFANDGGPLLVVPRSPAAFWEGSEIPSAGRVVAAVTRTVQTVATDYDRACDVDDGAALLDAGTGWVIALNSEVAGAAWIPLGDEPAAAAVVGAGGGSDGSLADIYASLADGHWTTMTDTLEIGEGGVFLMHAAGTLDSATEYSFDGDARRNHAFIGDAIAYPIPPGRYHAELSAGMALGAYAVAVRFSRTLETPT